MSCAIYFFQNYCRFTFSWMWNALSTYKNYHLALSTHEKSLSTLKFRDTPGVELVVATPHSIFFRVRYDSGDFTQDLLARLFPVTELGHLRPPAWDTVSRDVQRTRTASVEPVVATNLGLIRTMQLLCFCKQSRFYRKPPFASVATGISIVQSALGTYHKLRELGPMCLAKFVHDIWWYVIMSSHW